MNTDIRKNIVELLANRISEADKDPFTNGLEIIEDYFNYYVKSWFLDFANFSLIHTNSHCQWCFYVDFLGTTYKRITNDEDHYTSYKQDCENFGYNSAKRARLNLFWDYWHEQAIEEFTHEISQYINEHFNK